MSIVVVGSVAYDHVETPHGKNEHAMGGAALYFANSACFFSPVNMVAVVGKDFEHEKIEFLKSRNVDLEGIETAKGKTFRWGGRYHKNMNQRDTLFTELNVFADFKPSIPDSYKNSEYVFLANIHPELQLDVLNQVNKPKLVVMDTMNFWISGERESLKRLLKKIDILIINDEEAKELAEEENLKKALDIICFMGPKSLVVKKGEHGAMLYHEGNLFLSPAFPLEKVIDPTGAGDTFAGGFLGYLAKSGELTNKNLRKAVVYGSTLASFVCEDFSFDKLKLLTESEIEKRYNSFKELTEF
jgi:sugar/nucleoside kinase (ribokinase family)